MPGSRGSGRSVQAAGRLSIDVVLLTWNEDQFLLSPNGSRLRCPTVSLVGNDLAVGSLDVLVESLMRRQHGIEVSFLCLLAFENRDPGPGLVMVAATVANGNPLPDNLQWRRYTLAHINNRGTDVDHSGLFEMALRRRSVRDWAGGLAADIQRAFDLSIKFLDDHMSLEDGYEGWSQYQDPSVVGLLSTAEAMLAHVYAGAWGEHVNRPARTLEAMQNQDGGWQVRRSLSSARSNRSITESTSACLRALAEIGGTPANSTIRKGIEWLEAKQRTDGGWASSEEATTSEVFPTTTAIRALACFHRAEALAKGVAWLRSAQCDDGGWAANSRAIEPNTRSEPVYTASAVVALLAAGLPATEPAVARGCDHLTATFTADRAEPWPSTMSSSVIDSGTAARLEYRHFGTPWAIVALSLAGHDVGEWVLLEGVRRLLRLQRPDGTWHCAVVPAGSSAVWATHDALLALRAVRTRASQRLEFVAEERYRADELATARRVIGELLAGQRTGRGGSRRRTWLQTAWLSVLTVTVALVALGEFGVLSQLGSSSGLRRVEATVASVVVTAAGAVVPPLLVEEYKFRRRRGATPES